MSQRELSGVGANPVRVIDATAGNETYSLPPGFSVNRRLTVRRIDSTANTVTISAPSGQTMNGTLNGSVTVAGGSEVSFIPLDPGVWESFGANATANFLGTYVRSTGVAATDSANLQAAHDSFGTSGGTIRLDAGPYVLTGDAVNFTKPIRLIGYGPSGPNVAAQASFLNTGTLIQVATATGTAITVNSDGFHVEKCSFQNTSGTTPTSGSAIKFATKGRSFRLVDCDFTSFYINVDVINGYEWYIDRCHFFDQVYSSLQLQDQTLPDGGDGIVNACFFYSGPNHANPISHIQWRSGGGLKVIGTKFNARGTNATVGIDYKIGDALSTSVFLVNGCSFENMTYGLIAELDTGATGNIGKFSITGNEFLVSSIAIAFTPSAAGHINHVAINGNVGPQFGTLVSLKNVDNIDIGSNNLYGSGVTYLNLQGTVTNLKISGLPFTTAGRPAASTMKAGSWYQDTTLNKPVFADGAGAWRDAAGTSV